MPIETICQNCARKLRVDDEFAGRKARCPHCKTVYTVPQLMGADRQRPSESDVDGESWRLRTEDGNVYGPVSKSEVDVWFTEGRITENSQLQRDGTYDWLPATTVYPVLAKTAAQPVGTSANPFAEGAPQNTNPYSAPTTVGPTIRPRHHTPHRGGTILALGVIGVACCNICSPIAWVMGQGDLKQIREGQMDPTGRGLTQAGMVLGIIGTVILVAQVVFGVLGVLLD